MQKTILSVLVLLVVALAAPAALMAQDKVIDPKSQLTMIKGGGYILPTDNTLSMVFHTYAPLTTEKDYIFGITARGRGNMGKDEKMLTAKGKDLYDRLNKSGACNGDINGVVIEYRRLTVTTFILSNRVEVSECVVGMFEKVMK